MTIEREDAARALRNVSEAVGRLNLLEGYERAGAFLILWGLIWAICDLASYLAPAHGSLVWTIGDGVGLAGSLALAVRAGAARAGVSRLRRGLAALIVIAAVALFAFGISTVGAIHSFAQAQAVAGIAVGSAYVGLGAGKGLRIAAIGAVMIAVTLGGWVYAREQFLLWMALAGGGGLVLGGFWLRSV